MSESRMLGDRTKTRFDPDLARRMNERADAEENRRKLEDRLKPKAAKPAEDVKPSETAQSSVSSGSLYELMDRTDTYALGAHALRKACDSANPTFAKKDGSGIYRPLTFEENIRARMDDYNTLNNPDGNIDYDEIYDSLEGWMAYAKQADTYNLRKKIILQFESIFDQEISSKEISRHLKHLK